MPGEIKERSIKTWPVDDRPREKLLKKGPKALSNFELLAILLRTGTHGFSAIDLARSVMKKFGTFRNMAHTDARDWIPASAGMTFLEVAFKLITETISGDSQPKIGFLDIRVF